MNWLDRLPKWDKGECSEEECGDVLPTPSAPPEPDELTYVHVYFVAFSYKEGHGNLQVFFRRPIDSFEHIQGIEEHLRRTGIERPLVSNYIKLREGWENVSGEGRVYHPDESAEGAKVSGERGAGA